MTELKKSLLAALWFGFLTFPLMVIKVDPIERTVLWRWHNLIYVVIGVFFLSFLARWMMKRKEMGKAVSAGGNQERQSLIHRLIADPGKKLTICLIICASALIFPHLHTLYAALYSAVPGLYLASVDGMFSHLTSSYQVTIMTTALMYVVLGLGLNIVVGMAGLLDLGFVAFYAVGAYTYALLHLHYGLSFWLTLPIGGILAAIFGILLGFPVLRLRGDYLAIVTLGFGEIIRLVLENWGEFTRGPSGISDIPRPGFFGMDFSLEQAVIYTYYITLAMVIITIFVVNRLQDSRLGRAWIALREDEIACQAMGINKIKTKLAAFSLGALWAGFMGVVLAGHMTYINPKSFTFLQSAIILAIVVLGGMGSIIGVIIGALILILLPEYLRGLSEFRMLAFGAILVCMMVFRPQGLISNIRRTYRFEK
ncbi:MAG: branched-chain amino acid ABC transporter permease [Deltaproteobacteria bacterium]|nr:MAG: branched-chain amino acid ABC transporter permease [Deltaproteobacteria bacterium]